MGHNRQIGKHLNSLDMVNRFAWHYVQCNDAREAAILAGVKGDIDSTVARWLNNTKVLGIIEYEKLVKRSNEKVSPGWVIGEIKAVYAKAKEEQDSINCLKALDMLAKHTGIYGNGTDGGNQVTVVVRNFGDNNPEMKDAEIR